MHLEAPQIMSRLLRTQWLDSALANTWGKKLKTDSQERQKKTKFRITNFPGKGMKECGPGPRDGKRGREERRHKWADMDCSIPGKPGPVTCKQMGLQTL